MKLFHVLGRATAVLLPLTIVACASAPAEDGDREETQSDESAVSAGQGRAAILAKMKQPTSASAVAGKRVYLKKSGRWVTLGAFTRKSPGGDCTVDLDQVADIIDEKAVLLQAQGGAVETVVVPIHVDIPLRYVGWGMCWGRGHDCAFDSFAPIAL